MNIPENYEVLFLGGGASTQFFHVPANLLKNKAAYLQTGVWAKKAAKEAKFYGDVEVVASSEDKTYSYIPKDYVIPTDADYFHITTNNTIYGTEIRYDMDCPIDLVADMSSDIMSRPVDVSKYALIYGGAQKNVGPAGVTFVIIRRDLLGKLEGERKLQTMVDYRTHAAEEDRNISMFNTPPVFPIFVMKETLQWVKDLGGVEAVHKMNKEKAAVLYDYLDSQDYYIAPVKKDSRSLMNVTFVTGDADLDKKFASEAAKEAGCDEAVFHRGNIVTEGSHTANFIIKDGKVTPTYFGIHLFNRVQ